MRSRPPTLRRLFGILGVSIVLHLVVFGVSRVSRQAKPDAVLPDALEIVSISDLAPRPSTDPPLQSSGAPAEDRTGAQESPQETLVEPLVQASLLAELRAGMRSLTALKRAALTMDDSDIALASAQAADTILAAPYPFARAGGVRIGLAGGGNCPATFP